MSTVKHHIRRITRPEDVFSISAFDANSCGHQSLRLVLLCVGNGYVLQPEEEFLSFSAWILSYPPGVLCLCFSPIVSLSEALACHASLETFTDTVNS